MTGVGRSPVYRPIARGALGLCLALRGIRSWNWALPSCWCVLGSVYDFVIDEQFVIDKFFNEQFDGRIEHKHGRHGRTRAAYGSAVRRSSRGAGGAPTFR